MSGLKKTTLFSSSNSNSFYQSLYLNPMNDSGGDPAADKENAVPAVALNGCGLGLASSSAKPKKNKTGAVNKLKPKPHQAKVALKPSSLQLCMQLREPDAPLSGSRPWDPLPSSSDVWDFSDTEAAPASSWSTLPNRALLCRPLPLDVGRCTCVMVKEAAQGSNGVSLYSLYTNEGQGRQDRKLAVAQHRRRNGRSEFIVAQNPKAIFCTSDEGFLGTITSNLMGSKYQIWDQGSPLNSSNSQFKRLLGVVQFIPTITTLTGSFRSMKAWIPKHHSMNLKNTNTTKIQHINGLPPDWEEKKTKAHQLCSKVPYYNTVSKRYELDFRERAGRNGPKIRTSVKNFQLTMEEKGRQTILQLGRIGKSKYLMDYRYPLTGYQAFCICLASIDSKLCCSL